MLSLVRITSALFPEIYQPLLRDWDPRITRDMWQRAFTSKRPGEEDLFGYALADGSRIVGLMGMRFSERTIRGQTARFCNLHSWKVLSEYRAKSFMLMRPALALKEHTLTDLTSGADVAQMLLRLGFVELAGAAIVLPPLPWNGAGSDAMLEEMTEPSCHYAARLTASDLRIYEDHQAIDCGHLLVSTPRGDCYLVYSRIEQRFRFHCYLHYISAPHVFAEQHAAIRSHLMRRTGTRFLVLDARHAAEVSVPFSFRVRGRQKLFRPYQTLDRDVDSLYSEIVYLKQSALPSLRPRLLTAASRRVWAALGRAS